jgi:hypothetical protein
MGRLKIEAFLSTPPCPNSVALVGLLNEMVEEYNEKVELITYEGPVEAFDQYHLTATPAVVVEELIKMVGFCPSKESLLSALQEIGLE